MRYLVSERISENIAKTDEGYLVCLSVPLTRTGELEYDPQETAIKPNPLGGSTVVSRTEQDIFAPETIASFEGKPVTIGHPDEFVDPSNWQTLTVGIVQNVRAGIGDDAGKLIGDLLITSQNGIDAVEKHGLREVSNGYTADIIADAPGKGRHINIRGNHVAIVPAGRCGSSCAIKDEKVKVMSFKEKVKAALSRFIDEEMPSEEVEAKVVDSTEERMAKIEASIAALSESVSAMSAAKTDPEAEIEVEDKSAEVVKEEAKSDAPTAEENKDELPSEEEVSDGAVIAPEVVKDAKGYKAECLRSFAKSDVGAALIKDYCGAVNFEDAAAVNTAFACAVALTKAQRRGLIADAVKPKAQDGKQKTDWLTQFNDAAKVTQPLPKL